MVKYVFTPEYSGPVDDNGQPLIVQGLKSFDPESSGLLENFEIQETGDIGANSGRLRFSVKCKKCQQILHSNTTHPPAYTEGHCC